ncbi:MATE family efflux transporter [Natrinema soli]|uniref:MATE family efflux transporter n=1 Tax=Natrinema soli TaxID=1930624 RepID=A0ABD5SM37_9EURY|nr:MATE family efflux transporter [Natrinema soli]
MRDSLRSQCNDATPVPRRSVAATPVDRRQYAADIPATRLSRGRFPLLAIAAVFGSVTVAGYEIARRMRDLINSLSWEFSIALSSLVGRHLGGEEEDIAATYGDEIIRFSLLFYVAAVFVIVFTEPIARLFVTEQDVVELAATFVHVTAVATIGVGLDEAVAGALRGGGRGDTR